MKDTLINRIKALITLSPKGVEYIKQSFEERVIEKGDYFLKEGDICTKVGFIVTGLLHYYMNSDGEYKTYFFAQENDFICNYESFIPQVSSTKNIQAIEDCRILQISYARLQELYKTLDQGERFGRVVIEQVFIQTLQDLSSFYTDSAEARYKKFIKEHPDLQQRMPQYYIASYVGIEPQSLSRIRKRIYNQS